MVPFRLGGLLRLRKLEEEQAAAELARANERREAAERRARRAQEDLAGSALPMAADELTFRAAVAGRASLMGLLAESAASVALAHGHADVAHRQWTGARTAVRTLDKLAERHDAAVAAEEAAEEQRVLDETATQRATRDRGEDR